MGLIIKTGKHGMAIGRKTTKTTWQESPGHLGAERTRIIFFTWQTSPERNIDHPYLAFASFRFSCVRSLRSVCLYVQVMMNHKPRYSILQGMPSLGKQSLRNMVAQRGFTTGSDAPNALRKWLSCFSNSQLREATLPTLPSRGN